MLNAASLMDNLLHATCSLVSMTGVYGKCANDCSEQGAEQETVNVSMTGLLGNHPYSNQMSGNSDNVPTTRPGCRRR